MTRRVGESRATGSIPHSRPEEEYQNPHFTTARDRIAFIRRRGLRSYAGGYGLGIDGSNSLYDFGRQFSQTIAKRLGVDVRPQADEKRYAWSDALQALYDYVVDVVVDPIFLTPNREASLDLGVIQYGVLEKYVALAWQGSGPAQSFRYDKEPDAGKFIDHPHVLEVFCLRDTTATEELVYRFRDSSTFGQKIRAVDYNDLQVMFRGSRIISGVEPTEKPGKKRSRKTSKKTSKEGRLFVCDMGVAEKLKSKIELLEGELFEWEISFSALLPYYPEMKGLPVGIPYRKADTKGEQWRNLLFDCFIEVVEESGFLVEAAPVLGKLGIRTLSLTEIKQHASAADLASEHKAHARLLLEGAPTTAQTVTHVGIKGHSYPLRQPLPSRDVINALSELPGLQHSHSTRRSEDLGLMFHRLFQTLRRIAPHDRTEDEDRQWDKIISLVDIERYEAENPVPEPVLGFVHAASATELELKLFTHPSEGPIRSPFSALPAAAAGGSVGLWFEGDVRFLDGQLEWVTFRWRPPLEADPAAWDAFDPPSEWEEE